MPTCSRLAFRWYCCEAPATSDAFARVEPQAVKLPRSVGPTPAVGHRLFKGTPPVWSQSATKVLEQFGASLPFDDLALVAAFPLDSVRAGQRFAVYKDIGTDASIRVGVVRDADVTRWR